MQIERNGQRVEARTQVAGRGRDGDHVVGFSHVRSISPTAACQELLNRRDRRSGGNFLENPNLKTPDLLSPPVGELLVSWRCLPPETKNPPARERRVLRVLPLLLRAGYKPPPASCFGQHGLIP